MPKAAESVYHIYQNKTLLLHVDIEVLVIEGNCVVLFLLICDTQILEYLIMEESWSKVNHACAGTVAKIF